MFGVLGFLFREWRTLTLVCSLPGLVAIYWMKSVLITKSQLFTSVFFNCCFFFVRFLPESPRWLYSRGCVREAEQALLHIIERNGDADITQKQQISLKQLAVTSSKKDESGFSFLLFEPLLRKITILNAFIWLGGRRFY